MAFTISAGAQSKTKVNTTTTETTSYMPDSTIVTATKTVDRGGYDKGWDMMVELKGGSCFGSGGFGGNVVLEHEFHKYLAWDVVSLDFSSPFDFDFVDFGIKTGLRYFTPYFWESAKMRVYANVAVGWDCAIWVDSDIRELSKILGRSTTWHGCGLSGGVGTQFLKHFYVGYTLEYSTAMKNTSHFAKIAYRF